MTTFEREMAEADIREAAKTWKLRTDDERREVQERARKAREALAAETR